MASGHKKRKAAALRLDVLNPAGLTNLPESERGNKTNLDNLMNISFYSRDGVEPTFTAGSTKLLTNSNVDGAFSLAGLTGEVAAASAGGPGYSTALTGTFFSSSMSSSIGIFTTGTKHYYFPAFGQNAPLSGATAVNPPVIIYTPDGPQAKYVPYYQGGSVATASITFGTEITGFKVSDTTHLVVYVGGQLSNGDQIRIVKPSDGTLFSSRFLVGSEVSSSHILAATTTASAAQLSSNLYRKAFLIPTSSIGDSTKGLRIEFCSLNRSSTTPVAGVFVVISSGSYTKVDP